MNPRSGSASARISRRCGVDSTTVHARYAQHVVNPQKPSATVNIGPGHQNFFATGHVQCFLRKTWSTMQRTARCAAGRPRSAPLIPPPVRLQACRCVRRSAVSTSSQVIRNSLASFGKNTSGGQGLHDLPSRRVALIGTGCRPALRAFRTASTQAQDTGSPPKVLR